MSKTVVKVGIIGCGRIAGHHCRAIYETVGAELVAVCDLNEERAKEFEQIFGVKSYLSYHNMLIQNPEINTVAIVTPSGMHFEHADEIITKYKKNIIVEKPTFMRPTDVQKAYELAKKTGVNIFAVFQNRNNLAVQRVKRGLLVGELGDLRVISVRVRWCREQRYYNLAPWRGTFAMDGGCLTNQGIHHIDLLRYLGGEIAKVCSVHRTLGVEAEIEDTVTATIQFENGAIGALEITTAARPIDYEASISLVGENGLAQIGGIAVNELQLYSPDPVSCETNSEDFSGNVYGNGHNKIYEQIVDHFNGVADYPMAYDDVLKTIQLLNSFYCSDEEGGWLGVNGVRDSKRLGRSDNVLSDLYRTKH
jgi:UDP-N-acetyl-2-amino-2-deoxyglucuronate dehydrogenase